MGNEVTPQADPRTYLRPLRRWWWLILVIVIPVTVGTYFYYEHQPKVYQASTQIYIQPSSKLEQVLFGSGSFTDTAAVNNLALLVSTAPVANEAARELKKQGLAGQVSGGVSAAPVEESSFIGITGVSNTPQGAAILANTYAKAFIVIQTEQLQGQVKQAIDAAEEQLNSLPTGSTTENRRADLESRMESLQVINTIPKESTGITQVQKAFPPSAPTSPKPKRNAIFAFVVSLMLAIGAAFGLEYMTRRFNSVEAVEEIFEVPVLTEVPKVDGPSPSEGAGITMQKQLHEPFHRLQMNLDMLSHQRPLRTILIASAAPGEGKSVVTRNLALAYREAGRNVAVLDADFRKATLGGLLDAQEGPGLTDILAGRASFGQAVQEVIVPPTENGNNGAGTIFAGAQGGTAAPGKTHGDLAMVPAGPHTASLAAELASGGMQQTLRTATDIYDRVLIDSSPLLATADVLPLLSEVDGVLIVTRLGESTRDSARRLMAELRRVPNINLIGVVVNGIPSRLYRTRAYGYYYG